MYDRVEVLLFCRDPQLFSVAFLFVLYGSAVVALHSICFLRFCSSSGGFSCCSMAIVPLESAHVPCRINSVGSMLS